MDSEQLDRLDNIARDTLIATDTGGERAPGNLVDAVLEVAKGLNRIAAALDMDRLSHAGCMAIRHGLFGAEADSSSSILERPES